MTFAEWFYGSRPEHYQDRPTPTEERLDRMVDGLEVQSYREDLRRGRLKPLQSIDSHAFDLATAMDEQREGGSS